MLVGRVACIMMTAVAVTTVMVRAVLVVTVVVVTVAGMDRTLLTVHRTVVVGHVVTVVLVVLCAVGLTYENEKLLEEEDLGKFKRGLSLK